MVTASLVRRVGFFGRCQVSLQVRQHRNQYLGFALGSWMSKLGSRKFGKINARPASVVGGFSFSVMAVFQIPAACYDASRLAQPPERITADISGL